RPAGSALSRRQRRQRPRDVRDALATGRDAIVASRRASGRQPWPRRRAPARLPRGERARLLPCRAARRRWSARPGGGGRVAARRRAQSRGAGPWRSALRCDRATQPALRPPPVAADRLGLHGLLRRPRSSVRLPMLSARPDAGRPRASPVRGPHGFRSRDRGAAGLGRGADCQCPGAGALLRGGPLALPPGPRQLADHRDVRPLAAGASRAGARPRARARRPRMTAPGTGWLTVAERGSLVVSAHLGSFDALRLVADQGGVALNVAMFLRNARMINTVFTRLNPSQRLRIIDLERAAPHSVFDIRACLQRGEFVGMLADRVGVGDHTRVSYVPFLGERAAIPHAPFLLASALKCPVLLMIGLRRDHTTYEVFVEMLADEIVLPAG